MLYAIGKAVGYDFEIVIAAEDGKPMHHSAGYEMRERGVVDFEAIRHLYHPRRLFVSGGSDSCGSWAGGLETREEGSGVAIPRPSVHVVDHRSPCNPPTIGILISDFHGLAAG